MFIAHMKFIVKIFTVENSRLTRVRRGTRRRVATDTWITWQTNYTGEVRGPQIRRGGGWVELCEGVSWSYVFG